jgi:hypothetical protein
MHTFITACRRLQEGARRDVEREMCKFITLQRAVGCGKGGGGWFGGRWKEGQHCNRTVPSVGASQQGGRAGEGPEDRWIAGAGETQGRRLRR